MDLLDAPNGKEGEEERHAAPPSPSNDDDKHAGFFFADMTLDLADAHDIAETPEPKRKVVLDHTSGHELRGLEMPTIPTISEEADGADQIEADPDIAGAKLDLEKPMHKDEEVRHSRQAEGGNGLSETLNRISSDQVRGRASGVLAGGAPRMTPSSRRYPRDIPWAVAFCIFVPFSLLIPILTSPPISHSSVWLATNRAARLATMHTLVWGLGAALILTRLLYRTMGGGDGDDARHLVSQILLASGPLSASVYIAMALTIYFMAPGAFHFTVIPLWYLGRDIYLFRRWKRTSTTPGGRQAFFQALACMTLDIISRSLRRSSFHRVVLGLVVIQFVVISIWRLALLGALRSESTFMLLLAIIGGKWATGTVARLLSLISSGGVSSWFAQQNDMVTEMQQGNGANGTGVNSARVETETIDFQDANESNPSTIPEAYRSAAASAYKPALDVDEGMDDDFEDEDEAFTNIYDPRELFSTRVRDSTVKNSLFTGLSISFGSVAQCGLLGGVAQFVWSQLRKIDHARQTLRGFQGMNIGAPDVAESGVYSMILEKANSWSREFVRNHSDMGMCHVAAYQKNYRRAARDVAQLVEESGVEPIVDEDISTHMSACVGGSVAGIIVIFTGSILAHQKHKSSTDIGDTVVVTDMLLAFVFCYTLMFTVMEPLRAGIKAVYVSFTEHPQSLSQAYPLIFHRLSRMSESNMP